jgi:hypothetical protein
MAGSTSHLQPRVITALRALQWQSPLSNPPHHQQVTDKANQQCNWRDTADDHPRGPSVLGKSRHITLHNEH